MALPRESGIGEFIGDAEIVPEKTDERCIAFVYPENEPLAGEAPQLFLRLPESTLSLDAVLKLIIREHAILGHHIDQGTAFATLGLIAETLDRNTPPIEHAEFCISKSRPATLRHAVVLPNPGEEKGDLQFGDIRLHAFDPAKYEYWSKRSKCGYPVPLADFAGRFSVEPEPFETSIIDWAEVPGIGLMNEKWGPEIATISLLDSYFQSILRRHTSEIPRKLREALLILEGSAFIHVDERSLVESLLASNIGLFSWKSDAGPRGWALLSRRNYFHCNMVPKTTVDECRQWLSAELGFEKLRKDSHLDKTITLYCGFLQKAHRARLDGETNEAFLNFMIALDLLLGQDGRSSESVSLRASAVVHRDLEGELEAQVKRMKKLYGARSKYVHVGTSVQSEDMEYAEKVCLRTLWCLLSVSAQGKMDSTEDWIAEVDYIAYAIRARKTLDESEFARIGMAPPSDSRTPPNRVLR